jgi:hypothetical protein
MKLQSMQNRDARRCNCPRAIVATVGVMLLLPATITRADEASNEFQAPVGQRQLFLDDHGIGEIKDLRRTMHQPTKRGAVIRSPQPTKTIQTRTAPVWDEQAGLYKIWVITVDDNLGQSKDGLHWAPGPKTNLPIMMAVRDPRDPDPSRRFKAPLLNRGYEGVYIGLPAMFHAVGRVPNYPNTDGFHLVQLVCSRDLTNWQRLGDRQTFIGPSRIDSGAYDLTQILPPSPPVVRDDELRFYYTGLKWRSTFKYIGKYPDGEHEPIHGRDRDGLVSLDAGEQDGTILTAPFTMSGNRLHVNVDADNGELRVEILNPQHEVVASSETIEEDWTNTELSWQQGQLGDLQGQTVQLRFTLRNASLFSYWLTD